MGLSAALLVLLAAGGCASDAKKCKQGAKGDFPACRRACDKAHKDATKKHRKICHLVGVHYLRGINGVKKDLSKAVAALRKGCRLSHPKSCGDLGSIYAGNSFFAQKRLVDIGKAAEFFKRACELKQAASCISLGHHVSRHQRGKLKGKPFALWFDRACSVLKFGPACAEIGYNYAQHRKAKLAIAYLRKACTFNPKQRGPCRMLCKLTQGKEGC